MRGVWSSRPSPAAWARRSRPRLGSPVSSPGSCWLSRTARPGTTCSGTRGSSSLTPFVRGALFGESRKNGTPLELNDTRVQEISGGTDLTSPSARAFTLRGSYATQTHHQTFTSLNADRAAEALTRDQRVPSTGGRIASVVACRGLPARARGRDRTALGGRAQRRDGLCPGQSHRTAERQRARAELGALRRRSRVTRVAYAPDGGGTRRLLARGRRVILAGAPGFRLTCRHALPRSGRDGHESAGIGPVPRDTAASTDWGGLRRVPGAQPERALPLLPCGQTIALANPALTEDRLWGGELGTSWSTRDERLRRRAVGFLARIDNPVSNVTLKMTPQLITQQRQNLGRTRSRGAEVDAEALFGRRLYIGLGYALTGATVQRFAADPTLVGQRRAAGAQVPVRVPRPLRQCPCRGRRRPGPRQLPPPLPRSRTPQATAILSASHPPRHRGRRYSRMLESGSTGGPARFPRALAPRDRQATPEAASAQ